MRLHRVCCVLCFLLLASGLLTPAFVFAQTKGKGPTPQYGGTYRRPLSNNPSTLDPAVVTDTNAVTVIQQIFDGLVQYDNSLSITPALAETWKSSRDNLVWTFFLRKGVKFHNGRELVADDVVFSFLRILDPKVRSSGAEVFANVKGARDFIEGRTRSVSGFRVLDPHTIEISLAEASAPFVSGLAIGYAKVVPREAVQASGVEFGSHPVGTGPFKFAGWKKDEMIQLEANPDYFAGRPFLDRVQYRIFPGQMIDQMYSSFGQRELEDTAVPTAELGAARENKQHQFVNRPVLGVRFFGFNTAQDPLSDRALRQAFNFAIDRDALMKDVYKGRYKPGRGFLPPGTYGHDPQSNPYPHDPQRARTLLTKAGFPDGKGLPVFQIWSNPRSETIEREHAAIRQQLAAVGIQVEFRYNTDFPSFNREMYEGKMPVFRYGWVGDVPEPENFLYRLFHSQGRNNMTRYRNPKVDRLLDEARMQQNLPKRVSLYREAERLILDDAPIIPLSYYSYERIFQPYVRSIEVNALGDPYMPMRKIWLAK